ncbi:MAG TPA: hypothetical protein VJJ82_02455 [Candidatus Nanoarchaeia archaeon]|nr:hypothetical protein [Candidatus Nanoarchaeia archaeon]
MPFNRHSLFGWLTLAAAGLGGLAMAPREPEAELNSFTDAAVRQRKLEQLLVFKEALADTNKAGIRLNASTRSAILTKINTEMDWLKQYQSGCYNDSSKAKEVYEVLSLIE